jgi:DNA-binding beta-propeller fold protein YncE
MATAHAHGVLRREIDRRTSHIVCRPLSPRERVATLGLPAMVGLTVALATSGTASAAAPPPVGGLTQLTGQAGCVTAVGGNAACAQAAGVDGASSAVISPDGRNLYLASYKVGSTEALATFSRDPVSGAVTPLPGLAGCLTADGSSALGPATCGTARGFGVGDGRDLAITSDGRWAYLVNQQARSFDPPPAIVLLRRDPSTGALSQLPGTAGCISSDGSSQDGAGTCQTLATLGQPFGISISSDDAFVYVTDYGQPSRIHVLARDPVTAASSSTTRRRARRSTRREGTSAALTRSPCRLRTAPMPAALSAPPSRLLRRRPPRRLTDRSAAAIPIPRHRQA